MPGKDLIANIPPSPEYVIESYLEATLLLNDPASLEQRQARLKKLYKETDVRHTFWRELEDFDPVNKQWIAEESYQHLSRFWHVIEKQYLPAIASGDMEAALTSYVEIAKCCDRDRRGGARRVLRRHCLGGRRSGARDRRRDCHRLQLRDVLIRAVRSTTARAAPARVEGSITRLNERRRFILVFRSTSWEHWPR